MDNHMSQRKFDNKITADYKKLVRIAEGMKELNNRIVMTIGSWDVLHIGHVRYLIQAKMRGDILIVGVDSDDAVRLYKGPTRPIIPQSERMEMLSYQSCVDFVTLVEDVDAIGNWQYALIKDVRPDVFIAVEDSYPEEQLAEIRKYCGEVVVLPRQAENTSTSKVIQDTVKKYLDAMKENIPLLERRKQ